MYQLISSVNGKFYEVKDLVGWYLYRYLIRGVV